MKCVHFGAGNIGRGFVGLLMHRSGYEVVFADVAAPLIDALASTPSYTVHEVGAGSRDTVVEGYRALNSADDPESVVAEIAGIAHVRAEQRAQRIASKIVLVAFLEQGRKPLGRALHEPVTCLPIHDSAPANCVRCLTWIMLTVS